MEKKKNRLTFSKHSVYNISYHLVWCSKYTRKVLVDGIERRLKGLIEWKAEHLGISIEKMDILPDHVQLLVKCSPVDSPHHIVHQFKAYTSKILREKYPQLKSRLPSLWIRSFFCESVGHISKSTIIQFIEEQKKI